MNDVMFTLDKFKTIDYNCDCEIVWNLYLPNMVIIFASNNTYINLNKFFFKICVSVI